MKMYLPAITGEAETSNDIRIPQIINIEIERFFILTSRTLIVSLKTFLVFLQDYS